MEIRCSHCGATLPVEERPLLNTAQDPELKARVKDGSLFVLECPYCVRGIPIEAMVNGYGYAKL